MALGRVVKNGDSNRYCRVPCARLRSSPARERHVLSGEEAKPYREEVTDISWPEVAGQDSAPWLVKTGPALLGLRAQLKLETMTMRCPHTCVTRSRGLSMHTLVELLDRARAGAL